jgi:hypothetical protein
MAAGRIRQKEHLTDYVIANGINLQEEEMNG